MKKDILINAWHNIWPASIFLDGEDENKEFFGFYRSHENKTITIAKNVSNEIAIDEEIIKTSLNADKNAPPVLQLTDKEIAKEVLDKKGSDSSSEDKDVEETESAETISKDRCIELTKELIHGMEQKSFFKEHDIMSVYKIQETLLLEKPKH